MIGMVAKIQQARALVLEECAKLAEDAESDRSRADSPYDSGAGSCGYALACSDIAAAIRAKIEPPVPMCDHDWEEYESQSDGSVICKKCRVHGGNRGGEVYWPAT